LAFLSLCTPPRRGAGLSTRRRQRRLSFSRLQHSLVASPLFPPRRDEPSSTDVCCVRSREARSPLYARTFLTPLFSECADDSILLRAFPSPRPCPSVRLIGRFFFLKVFRSTDRASSRRLCQLVDIGLSFLGCFFLPLDRSIGIGGSFDGRGRSPFPFSSNLCTLGEVVQLHLLTLVSRSKVLLLFPIFFSYAALFSAFADDVCIFVRGPPSHRHFDSLSVVPRLTPNALSCSDHSPRCITPLSYR